MWLAQLWSVLLFSIAALESPVTCNPVTPNFNDNLREFSVKEDVNIDNNSTVRTLQKEDLGRYANFAPIRNPIRFKEIPDNALSSSSYRGLAHPDHGGYGFHEYEESPHYGYSYDEGHHGGFDHGVGPSYGFHGHHLSHGHHHKHYNHALAAKTILWPLAGLALLGTAAALVSNPVLLQLGVISGRRRRDVKEVTNPGYDFKKWDKEILNADKGARHPKTRVYKDVQQGIQFRKAYATKQSAIQSITVKAPEYYKYSDEDRFVPVSLEFKHT